MSDCILIGPRLLPVSEPNGESLLVSFDWLAADLSGLGCWEDRSGGARASLPALGFVIVSWAAIRLAPGPTVWFAVLVCALLYLAQNDTRRIITANRAALQRLRHDPARDCAPATVSFKESVLAHRS